MIPAEYRKSGFTDYGAPGWTMADTIEALRRRRVLPRPDAHHAALRHRRLRRHAVQGAARQRATTSRSTRPRATACCVQTNINNTRSDVAHLIKVLADMARGDREAPGRGRRGGAGGLRGAGEVAGGGRAGPAELQPLPRRLPRRPEERDAAKATCARPTTWPTTPANCEYVKLDEQGDRRAAEEGPGAGLGEVRDPVPAGLPDHGAGPGHHAGDHRRSCASST